MKTKTKILITMSILFIIFFLISYFIPLTGDDWTNSNFNTINLLKIIKIAIGKYYNHEGRIVSRIFVIFFTNCKSLWNIFNAIMVSLVYYCSIRIIKPKHFNLISILFIFSMFVLENTTFTQSYVWVTGNLTYFLPMTFFIIYISIIDKIFDNNFNISKFEFIICIILNLLIPTMVENISFALVFANFILILYCKIKNKKINKLFITNFIISLIGFLILILSPGAKNRAQSMDFSNFSIFKKVLTNIPNFINYTYILNGMLIILILILFLIFINKKLNNNLKYFLNIIIFITLFFNIIYSFILFGYNNLNSQKIIIIYNFLSKIVYLKYIYIIYWLLVTLFLIYINCIYVKDSKNYRAFFLFIIGMASNLAMLMSPIWGGRTSLFTIIILSISLLIIIDFYIKDKNKIINISLYALITIYFLFLLILYGNIYIQQKNREASINKQIESSSNEIVIESFPEYALWNSNAWNRFHENSLKEYYGIDENIQVSHLKVKYKFYLLYER